MKKLLILLLLLPVSASAQRNHSSRKPLTEGFYVNIGMVKGPEFTSFVNYVNTYYGDRYLNTTDKLHKFGKAATMSLGYVLRLYPSFALDVGFTIYRLESQATITNHNPSINEPGIRHDLEYQVGLFSFTLPVLLDFSPRQPVVPYAGIGISIFAMRLDDFKDDGTIVSGSRDTGTTVGGHFETGLYLKLKKKLWIDLNAKWFKGSGNLRAQEPDGLFDKFKVDQDITHISAGAIYFFR